MRLWMTVLISLFSAGLASSVSGQDYPNRTIRVVVPFSPGGATDILARLVGQQLTERLKQPVIVENRAGGGGHIGAGYVAKAPPDGYTLLAAGIPQAIGMSLYKNLPYQMEKDLAPITMFATFPSVIAVHPSLPVKSVKGLLALARKRPGELNFGAVTGSPNHLAIVLLNVMGKVNMVHVPYKGGGPVVIDLVAGNLQVAAMGLPPALGMVKAGKLRPIAVTSAQRSAVLPDVPTVQESGVPGYEVTSWYGMFAPTGTPDLIILKLHSQIAASLKAKVIVDRLATLGAEASGIGPEEFGKYVRAEIAKWAEVVKISGAKAD